MTARSMLLAQIDSTVNSIDQGLERLKSDKLESGLLKRIHARFVNDLNGAMRQVTTLRDLVRKLPDDASLETSWARHDSLRSGAEMILRECLAFIAGALTRAAGIDAGLCRLTDAMLYDLSSRTDLGWNRFTILAEGEFFAALSGIIRIRFPDLAIWNLPVAAHEFGHYVMTAMNDPTVAAMVEREKRKELRYAAYLSEHFADLFASYTMGPCFGLACGLVRFSPASAAEQSATHPSAAQRMWWILETLRSLDRMRHGGPPLYDYIAEQLEQSWTAGLSAAGQAIAISAEDAGRLRPWLAEMLDALDRNLSGAQYSGWLRAQDLADSLRNKRVPTLANTDRIPDVLNAAWLCRSETEPADGYQVSWLAETALKLCAELTGTDD